VPQLSYRILLVCLDLPRLVDAAGTKPPELLDDLIDDIDTTLRRLISSPICDLTDRSLQQVFLPVAVESGGFMNFRCSIRAAFTASLLDTADSRSMFPGSPAAAPLLRLLYRRMLPTHRALEWQMRLTCNLRPSSPVSVKPSQHLAWRGPSFAGRSSGRRRLLLAPSSTLSMSSGC
jgi:hypothetical protein